MTQTLAEKLLELGNTNYPNEVAEGEYYGALQSGESFIKIEGDTVTQVTLEKTLILAGVSSILDWSEELLHAINFDNSIDPDDEDATAYKLDDNTLLIGNSDTVVILGIAMRLKAPFEDLEEGALVFGYDEEPKETIDVYSAGGKKYNVPFEITEDVN